MLTADLDRDQVPAGEDGVRARAAAAHPGRARRAARAAGVGHRRPRRPPRAGGLPPDLDLRLERHPIPQAALRVLADSGVPMAFRVCEHWFGRLFAVDQFLRELAPARRSPPRARMGGAAAARFNRALPSLRLDPLRRFDAAISWNSEAIRRMAGVAGVVEAGPGAHRPLRAARRRPLRGGRARTGARARDRVHRPRDALQGAGIAIEALALLRDEHGLRVRLTVVGPEDAAARRRDARAGARPRRGRRDRVARLRRSRRRRGRPGPHARADPPVDLGGAVPAGDDRGRLRARAARGLRRRRHRRGHARRGARAAVPAATIPRRRPARWRATLRDTEQTAARVERAHVRAQEFRLEPYLEAQAQFVLDAHEALQAAGGAQARARSVR